MTNPDPSLAGRYQLFPALRPEEYEALKQDIAARGIMVPIEIDDAGAILDGHDRAAIAAELGIGAPTVTRHFESEQAKREHVIKLNLARRHLDPIRWGQAFEQLLEVRGVGAGQGSRNDQTTSATVAEVARELGVSARTARWRTALAHMFAELSPDQQAKITSPREVREEFVRLHRRQQHRESAAREQTTADTRWTTEDHWTSASQWLLTMADRTEYERPPRVEWRFGPPFWPIPLAGTEMQRDKLADGVVALRRVTPQQILGDSRTVATITLAQQLHAQMWTEVQARVALFEKELAAWFKDAKATIVAVLEQAADDASDDPSILIGRRHVWGGQDAMLADIRMFGVPYWTTPHSADGSCACQEFDCGTPLGCYLYPGEEPSDTFTQRANEAVIA
jgi:ParB-like chromosome segregation protein Spo0J